MWRRVFLHLYFVVLLCQSVTYISGNPLRNDKIEKQQELVGKIVDLIKREQIRMNLIEEDKGDFFQQNQNFWLPGVAAAAALETAFFLLLLSFTLVKSMYCNRAIDGRGF